MSFPVLMMVLTTIGGFSVSPTLLHFGYWIFGAVAVAWVIRAIAIVILAIVIIRFVRRWLTMNEKSG